MKVTIYFKTIIILGLYNIFIPQFATPQWTTTQSEDEMSGVKRSFAFSETVESSTPMRFPYTGTTARIAVGCDNDSEWAYIIFSETPNLLNVTIEDGRNRISTRMRWDQDIENVTLIQRWGAKSLHFLNAQSVIHKLITSNEVLLELDWYGENKTYFRFPLDGSSNAINNIRSECAKY